MLVGPRHDPRTSATHRALLETPGTLSYLPYAIRWALRLEVALVASLFGGLLGLFAPSWIGVFFVVFFGSAAATWLMTIQQRAIFGYGDAPVLAFEHFDLYRSNAETLFELGGAVSAGYAVLYLTSPEFARWYAWGIGALLPAMFAVVAVEGELLPAFDPRRVFRVLFAAGPVGWLLAVGAAIGMEKVCRVSAEFIATLDAAGLAGLIHGWNPDRGSVLAGIGGLWLAAFAAHLQGHALHHSHERAGLPVVLEGIEDDDRDAERTARAVKRLADLLESAAAKGDRVDAHRVVAHAARDPADALPMLTGLWDAMRERRRDDAAVLVAKRLLPLAVAAKRFELARSVWTDARRLSPSFDPGPDVRTALAVMARAAGDRAVAEQCESV